MEASLSVGGEIKNPKRTIPRAIPLGISVIFILYLLIQFVSQGILGNSLGQQHDGPLAIVAGSVMGNIGKIMIVIGTTLSSIGLISGDVMSSSRLPYAAARGGLLPKFLSVIHPRYATPHVAILFYAGLGFILSASGGFRQLAVLSSAALLLIYIGVILATLKLRAMKPAEDTFIIPGGAIIPILALLATGWFLSNLAQQEIIGVLIFLVFFTIVYFVMRRVKRGSPLEP